MTKDKTRCDCRAVGAPVADYHQTGDSGPTGANQGSPAMIVKLTVLPWLAIMIPA